MTKMFKKSESRDHFNFALAVILISITVSIIAFVSEDKKITGFATVSANSEETIITQELREFNNINELGSLAPGNYYVDDTGIVYWLDDESSPAIAKVNFVRDEQKNRHIYIDNNGNVGYVLS